MDALVFADRIGHELMPLTRKMPVSLLPINGKPLIEHTLEDLAEADVRSVMLVVGEHGDSIEHALGHGSQWGIKLNYVRARSGESPTHLAKRYASQLPENFLAMRGDVYRSGSIKSFRHAANNVLATQVVAQINGRCAQLCLCRQRDMHLDLLSWGPTSQPRVTNWRTIDLGGAEFSQLHDITEFYLTNIDGLDERVAELNTISDLSGRQFYSAPNSRFRPGVVRDGPVLIGSDCEIGQGVQLHGPVVLGDNVYIDEGAFLHACVVLPGTYIPPGTQLRNAVVTSEMAIGIGGNVICRFADDLDARSKALAN